MYRDKVTLSALIVSSSQKAADYLQDILSRLRFSPVAYAVSIAEAKRRQLENQFDLVIINALLTQGLVVPMGAGYTLRA